MLLLETLKNLVGGYLKEGALHEEQHAYLSNISVEKALLSVMEFIESQIEHNVVYVETLLGVETAPPHKLFDEVKGKMVFLRPS